MPRKSPSLWDSLWSSGGGSRGLAAWIPGAWGQRSRAKCLQLASRVGGDAWAPGKGHTGKLWGSGPVDCPS